MNKKELLNLLGISNYKILTKWLTPLCPELGITDLTKRRLFTPKQVAIIKRELVEM